MTGTDTSAERPASPGHEVYSPAARAFHWAIAILVAAQVPLAFAMTYRSGELRIRDGLTDLLYDTHKLIGVTILTLAAARLTYRLLRGVPGHEPTITPWQRIASRANHWAMYVLLFAVPLLGWLGASYYPSLDTLLFTLPGLVAPLASKEATEAMAEEVFEWHETAAFVLVGLIVLHIAAALYHRFIRKDTVLGRMWPRRGHR